MKINYSEYPVLKDIENGTLENIKMCHSLDAAGFELFMDKMKKIWPYTHKKVAANVCIPCKTYIEAVEKSSPSFMKLLSNISKPFQKVEPSEWVNPDTPRELTAEEEESDRKLFELVRDAYGCYPFPNGESILFGIGIGDDGQRHMFMIDLIDGFAIRAIVQYGEDYTYFVTNNPVAAAQLTRISQYPIVVVSQLQNEINMLIMFERYAKVETRYLNPSTRARINFSEMKPSVNETGIKINIRDSSYFTTIIRKGDFMVNGHLRMQPKKINGEWTHELIYIDSFMKHGYTRKAKINEIPA